MNKKEVKQYVIENDVLTIKADKSSSNPLMKDINKLLHELGNRSAGLPYYVVYPAGGGEPVIFDGLITKGQILRELKKAVKAGRPAQEQTAAMEETLPWESFSREKLDDYRRQGQAVLVNFTADWGLVCKTNEAVALNKKEIKQFVTKNNVVTIKADKSSGNPLTPEINKLLKELGNQATGVPYYAIYPAGGGEPEIIEGLISKDQILKGLKKAVQAGGTVSKQTAAVKK